MPLKTQKAVSECVSMEVWAVSYLLQCCLKLPIFNCRALKWTRGIALVVGIRIVFICRERAYPIECAGKECEWKRERWWKVMWIKCCQYTEWEKTKGGELNFIQFGFITINKRVFISMISLAKKKNSQLICSASANIPAQGNRLLHRTQF